MFFSSIKEINRLISKGMSNIYLKVIEKKLTFSKYLFTKFRKFVSRSVFGGAPTRADIIDFKNLRIRGLGAKVCEAFLLL